MQMTRPYNTRDTCSNVRLYWTLNTIVSRIAVPFPGFFRVNNSQLKNARDGKMGDGNETRNLHF